MGVFSSKVQSAAPKSVVSSNRAPATFGALLVQNVTAALVPAATTTATTAAAATAAGTGTGSAEEVMVSAFYMPRELIILIVQYVPPPELLDWNPHQLWLQCALKPNQVKCNRCQTVFALPDPPTITTTTDADSNKTSAADGSSKQPTTAVVAKGTIPPPVSVRYVPTDAELKAAKLAADADDSDRDPYNRKSRVPLSPDTPFPEKSQTYRLASSELISCRGVVNRVPCSALFTDGARPSNRRQLLWNAMIKLDRQISDYLQQAKDRGLSDNQVVFRRTTLGDVNRARELFNVDAQHRVLLIPSLETAEQEFTNLQGDVMAAML